MTEILPVSDEGTPSLHPNDGGSESAFVATPAPTYADGELPAPDARVIGAEVPDLHDIEVIDGQRTRLRVDGGWVYTTWGLTEDGLDVTNPSSVFVQDPAVSVPEDWSGIHEDDMPTARIVWELVQVAFVVVMVAAVADTLVTWLAGGGA